MLAVVGVAMAGNDTTSGVPAPTVTKPVTPACSPAYHQRETTAKMRKVYWHHLHVTKKDRRHIKAMVGCQVGGEKATRNMRAARRKIARKRDIWKIRWWLLPAYERSWALNTAACESHNNAQAVSSHGDHGAMQFKLGTWALAGGTGDPCNASIYEQYVRAVWWKNKTSDEQWPNCGD
jgi:hypothetical protein